MTGDPYGDLALAVVIAAVFGMAYAHARWEDPW